MGIFLVKIYRKLIRLQSSMWLFIHINCSIYNIIYLVYTQFCKDIQEFIVCLLSLLYTNKKRIESI